MDPDAGHTFGGHDGAHLPAPLGAESNQGSSESTCGPISMASYPVRTVPLQASANDQPSKVSLQMARRKRYGSAGTGVVGASSWEQAHPADHCRGAVEDFSAGQLHKLEVPGSCPGAPVA